MPDMIFNFLLDMSIFYLPTTIICFIAGWQCQTVGRIVGWIALALVVNYGWLLLLDIVRVDARVGYLVFEVFVRWLVVAVVFGSAGLLLDLLLYTLGGGSGGSGQAERGEARTRREAARTDRSRRSDDDLLDPSNPASPVSPLNVANPASPLHTAMFSSMATAAPVSTPEVTMPSMPNTSFSAGDPSS